MVTILITGGFGYLGARLATGLHDDGHDLVLLERGSKRYDDPLVREWAKGFRIVNGDVTDEQGLTAAFRDAGPIDVVIHLAAVNERVCVTDPKAAVLVNVLGTRNALAAAKAAGARRFLYFSTFHVYGDDAVSRDETATPLPTHPYGITHLAAEHYCRAAAKDGLEVAIIRLSNAIGAPAIPTIDRWSLLLLDLCRQAHETKELRLATPGHQTRDFVAIDDIAKAVGLLIAAPASSLTVPIFNVGSGTQTSVRDVAEAIRRMYERLYGNPIALRAPDGEPGRHSAPFPIDRIRDLGFSPTTDIDREAEATLRFCEVFR